MFDLIYAGYEYYEEAKTRIKEKFPDAIIEDASDEIHEGRFSVKMDDKNEREYFKHLIREGFIKCSLDFNVKSMGNDKEEHGYLINIIREVKSESL